MSSEVFNRIIALILLIVAIALAWRAVNGENLSVGLPFLGDEENGDSVESVLRDAGRGLEPLAPSRPTPISPARPVPPTDTPTPTPTPIPAGW